MQLAVWKSGICEEIGADEFSGDNNGERITKACWDHLKRGCSVGVGEARRSALALGSKSGNSSGRSFIHSLWKEIGTPCNQRFMFFVCRRGGSRFENGGLFERNVWKEETFFSFFFFTKCNKEGRPVYMIGRLAHGYRRTQRWDALEGGRNR